MGRPSVAKSRHRVQGELHVHLALASRLQGWLQNVFNLIRTCSRSGPGCLLGEVGNTPDKCGHSSRPRGVSAGTSQVVVSQLRWPLAEGRVSAPGMCASVAQCPAALPLRSPKVQLGHMALRIPPFLLPSWGTWWLQVFCASDGTPLACPLSRPTEQFKTNCHHGRPYS